jgi:hypothetical protein
VSPPLPRGLRVLDSTSRTKPRTEARDTTGTEPSAQPAKLHICLIIYAIER